MRYVVVFVAACSSSAATPVTYGPARQVEIFTNLSPRAIDLVTDSLGEYGDFSTDAAGGIRDSVAGSTYSRLADVGPVAAVDDIEASEATHYVVVESVPLAVGEGYFVRAADGCAARLRVDDLLPASFGSAVEVTYERADCVQLSIVTTLNVTGSPCPPNQMASAGDSIDVDYGDWPLMKLSAGVSNIVLRVPRGAHVTLKSHGTSIAWSGACSGATCRFTADDDAAMSMTEDVMRSCFPGA